MSGTRLWGRIFWPLLALTLALYLAMALWSLPIVARDAGGLVPFDLRPFGYDTEAAREFLLRLGPDGRAQYQGPQRWLDLAFPGLMALSLMLAFWRLFGRGPALGLCAVALAAAAFDYAENIAVAGLLRRAPEAVTDRMVATASLMTVLKSVCVTVALLALLAGLGGALWRRARAA